jgi:hypothetical protein
MNKNGDIFEASIQFKNSKHTSTQLVVLVSEVDGIYRSIRDKAFYSAENIISIKRIDTLKIVSKKYLKFNFHMIPGMKTYIITIVNYQGHYLSLIKWHGYSYKEFREDHTEFDYSCSNDISDMLRRLKNERGTV